MPEDVNELEALINAEVFTSTAITILLTRSLTRETQALLEECKQIHNGRKDRLIKSYGEIVTELNLSMPPDMESVLLGTNPIKTTVVEFLSELEQKLLNAYRLHKPQISKNADRELIAQLTKEQEKLCTRVNVESQSITQVMDRHKRPS